MRINHRQLAVYVLASLACFACGDATSASGVGKVSAQVIDPNNAGVQGVNADLYKVVEGNPILWRTSLTSSNGIAVFGAADGGVVPGDYYIHLSFVTNYALATDETNDKPVTVHEGDDDIVTFHVVSRGPGH
jgi:hypothetical protein